MLFPYFQHILQQFSNVTRFCIAFSGGLDSTVLLHLLTRYKFTSLRAVHINHGLSLNSDTWSKHCQEICQAFQVPLIVKNLVQKKIAKTSLEEWARNERYKIFSALIAADEYLVTGHHQNDQAETLLLQLFRGAGPQGLAAMPLVAPFDQGFLLRPLLHCSRNELINYAHQHQLKWVEDESNDNTTFDRNFLRQNIIPLLEQRWPTVNQNIARAAQHCAVACNFISKKIKQIFDDIFDEKKNSLDLAGLLVNEEDIQDYLIRYWLQYLNFPLPSTAKLNLLRQEIIKSRNDAKPLLCWKNVEIRRYGGHLYVMAPVKKHDHTLVIDWNFEQDLLLPNDLGKVTVEQVLKLGINPEFFNKASIRFRQGGERCQLPNRKHSHSLKKLFQEWRIPPWERNRIPLLYDRDEIKAIIGYTLCI